MSNDNQVPVDAPASLLVSQRLGDASKVVGEAIDAARKGQNTAAAMMMAQTYALMVTSGNGLLMVPVPRSSAAMVCVAIRFGLETCRAAFEDIEGEVFASAAHELRRASGFLATTLQEIGFGHLLEVGRQ